MTKLNTKDIKLIESKDGWFIVTAVPNNLVDKLKPIIDKDVAKSIEIKVKGKEKTQSINAYAWVLMTKMAKMLTIPKGDMYVKMVKRYGLYESVIIKADAAEQLLKKWNKLNTKVEHTESLCEVIKSYNKGPVKWLEINCHYGTSGYEAHEYHAFVEGIVSDCKGLGIETMTPNEINIMMANYKEV